MLFSCGLVSGLAPMPSSMSVKPLTNSFVSSMFCKKILSGNASFNEGIIFSGVTLLSCKVLRALLTSIASPVSIVRPLPTLIVSGASSGSCVSGAALGASISACLSPRMEPIDWNTPNSEPIIVFQTTSLALRLSSPPLLCI